MSGTPIPFPGIMSGPRISQPTVAATATATQKVIMARDPADFSDEIQRHLNDGWRIVPNTITLSTMPVPDEPGSHMGLVVTNVCIAVVERDAESAGTRRGAA